MKLGYYHNPRCSKSRQGLELLENAGVEFKVVLYLETKLASSELETVIDKYLKAGHEDFKELIRTKEDEYKKLKNRPSFSDTKAWAKILSETPKLLERPLLVGAKQTVIGRPPENLLSSKDLS